MLELKETFERDRGVLLAKNDSVWFCKKLQFWVWF